MSQRLFVFTVVFGLGWSAAGCTRSISPSSPTAATAGPASAITVNAAAAGSTHRQQLTAVRGSGSGIVNVTPTAAVDGSFSAQITVNLHDAPPDTTFYVQRAPEIGRPLGSDGLCQRAAADYPWNGTGGFPAAAPFVTFPRPAAGPLVTLQTSAGGAGAGHIDFAVPTILDGTRFDVMFRLVDDLVSPANDLRSGCFTVEVK